MTGIQALALAAEVVAAIAAIVLARRRDEHRPAAVALVVFVVADAARVPIHERLSPPPSNPYTLLGDRLLFHASTSLWLMEEAVLPTLALAVCVENRRRAIMAMVALWALGSLGCAWLYPSPMVYGTGLAKVYLAVDLLGLFLVIVSFIYWARLHKSPTSSHVVAGLLAAADVGILLLPYSAWRAGIFNGYDTAQVALTVTFVMVTIYQGVLTWLSPARSSE